MQWQNIVFLILVLGIPAISTIAKKLRDQHEAKRLRDEKERRRMEFLRTGRTAPTQAAAPPTAQPGTPAAARQRLQDIAARRQAQIEELRRRRQQASGQATSAPAPARPSAGGIAPTTSRQAPPTRMPAPQRPVAQRPAGAPQQGPSAQDIARRREMERRRKAQEAAKRQARRSAEQAQQARDAIPVPPQPRSTEQVHTATPSGTSFVSKMRLEDWRRAIIMQEVLSPPVSMREDHDV
jgi:hypothetical protein